MKTLKAASAALLLSAGAAFAASPTPGADADETCATYAELAESIMTNRQVGTSLGDLLDVVGDVSPAREMVLSAFEVSRRDSAAGRERAVSEFRDIWHLECLRGAE